MTTPLSDEREPIALRGARQPYTTPAPPLAKRFGELVMYARKAKCLGQRAVAKAVGCSQPHIWHLERGHVNPDLALAARLIEVLGIDCRNVFDVMPKRRHKAA